MQWHSQFGRPRSADGGRLVVPISPRECSRFWAAIHKSADDAHSIAWAHFGAGLDKKTATNVKRVLLVRSDSAVLESECS